MKTLKELQTELASIQIEERRLYNYYNDPEYKRLSDELVHRRTKLDKFRRPLQDQIVNKRCEIEKLIKDTKQSKKFQPSAKLKEWCQTYFRGVEEIHEITWVSEDERFVIVHAPGGMYWSSRGQQSYGAATYELYDLSKVKDQRHFDFGVMSVSGRLTKERKQAFMKKIEEVRSGVV